jgi:hypothetical protein
LREKPRFITVQQWNTEGLDLLQASFDCTDWEVFITACDSIDELTETVSDYVSFCVQLTIPSKEVKVYPNNKPWITTEIKSIINKKKEAFGKQDNEQLRYLKKELSKAIEEQKKVYRQKIESYFTVNNMKGVWNGMRLMSGYSNGSSKSCPLPKASVEYANELNKFYNRFDCHDFSIRTLELLNNLANSDTEPFLCVSEEEVRKESGRLNPSKAAGPDVPLNLLIYFLTFLTGPLFHKGYQDIGKYHASFQYRKNHP